MWQFFWSFLWTLILFHIQKKLLIALSRFPSAKNNTNNTFGRLSNLSIFARCSRGVTCIDTYKKSSIKGASFELFKHFKTHTHTHLINTHHLQVNLTSLTRIFYLPHFSRCTRCYPNRCFHGIPRPSALEVSDLWVQRLPWEIDSWDFFLIRDPSFGRSPKYIQMILILLIHMIHMVYLLWFTVGKNTKNIHQWYILYRKTDSTLALPSCDFQKSGLVG